MDRRIKSFEDLDVWKYCRDLRNKMTKLARNLPADEKFRLSDQIIRAARSVTNNIAEGYGRFHYQENIPFCGQSRGSLYELIDHVKICHDEGYIDNEHLDKFHSGCSRGIQMINGYIRFLSKQRDMLSD